MAKEIVMKHIPHDQYAVFLFGSRAKGKAKSISDVDIGILGKAKLPVMLKADLEDELEESLIPYKVDLVDFYLVADEFKEFALKSIVIWNCPKNIEIN